VFHNPHGLGFVARNVKQRYAAPWGLANQTRGVDAGIEGEVRDLAVDDQLFNIRPAEAA